MSTLLNWILEHEESFRKSRLPSLYSDFSVQKSTNPDGFAANVTAWQNALAHAAKAGMIENPNGANDILVLHTSDQLVRELESPQFGRPSGLPFVLDDAVQQGLMIPLNDFESSPTSIYSKSWVPSPWKVVKWGLRQFGLGHAYSGQTVKVGKLVIVTNLEDVSTKVLAEMKKKSTGLTDRVMAIESFREELVKGLGVPSISATDMSALLKYLSRDKGMISYDEKTIKFRSPSSNEPEPLTSQDTTIASLKLLISGLNTQCNALSDRISSLSTAAREAVKSSNRLAAQRALRSRKIAENTFSQRSATLHQLEGVYAKLEQAVDQIEVVRVMEASAITLKSLNKQIGGVERVEDIIEDLREEMGKVDEVGVIINEPLNDQATLDEAELDDELEVMEKEEKAKVQEKEQEREAEATRKRLEEAGKIPELGKEDSQPEADQELEKAVNRLSGLSIDEQNSESQQQTVEQSAS